MIPYEYNYSLLRKRHGATNSDDDGEIAAGRERSIVYRYQV